MIKLISKNIFENVPVSIAQLPGTCIVKCRGRVSNLRYSTYPPWKRRIL